MVEGTQLCLPGCSLLKHEQQDVDVGGRHPVLVRAARDILAIPGVSVSVERMFSSLRHTLSDERASMVAQTIRMSVLSKERLKTNLGSGKFTDFINVHSK